MRVSFSSMWVPAAAMLLLPLAAAFSLQSPGLAARGAIAIGLRPTYSSMTRRATQGLKMGATDAVPKTLPRYTKFLVRLKVAGKDASLIVGLLFAVACFGWAAMLYPAIGLCYAFGKAFDQKRRRAVDWIVHWWAKLTCLTILYKPKVIGRENLPAKDEAVMYIPNHCSYLDIFTLSGFLPRAFKYVSKIEILRIPLIGWAMQAAGHIAIRRMDKRSQLQTFKDTVECLNNGNSIVTFAEGTRSASGRLMPFKKGPIKMAIKAKKRIVPISICDLHRWMPDSALTPLGIPIGVTIKVHPAIETAGRDENLILNDVFSAINSGLPEFQQADDDTLYSPGAATSSAGSGDE
uniref:1-acyl-sn-glycerol-3-phosphate acyltransferase n=1 Tax=Hemiselmis andersenii TaxID=464988 RepID=A0A6T8NGR0_HEMAN|mmetsp:Transcript_38963/g.90896  ORF Transcript_38963/g.90896 Transcript_38963/m.90896 type:complete len:349 (+) Transcript_38963:140-1186(+)